MNNIKPEEVPCGQCKKTIKGAQYRVKKEGGKNIWACEKCYMKGDK